MRQKRRRQGNFARLESERVFELLVFGCCNGKMDLTRKTLMPCFLPIQLSGVERCVATATANTSTGFATTKCYFY